MGATAAFAFGESAAFAVPGASVFEAARASLAYRFGAARRCAYGAIDVIRVEGGQEFFEANPHGDTSMA